MFEGQIPEDLCHSKEVGLCSSLSTSVILAVGFSFANKLFFIPCFLLVQRARDQGCLTRLYPWFSSRGWELVPGWGICQDRSLQQRSGALCLDTTQLPSSNKMPGEVQLLTDEECGSTARPEPEQIVNLTTAAACWIWARNVGRNQHRILHLGLPTVSLECPKGNNSGGLQPN